MVNVFAFPAGSVAVTVLATYEYVVVEAPSAATTLVVRPNPS
jgi:hypothetical protein